MKEIWKEYNLGKRKTKLEISNLGNVKGYFWHGKIFNDNFIVVIDGRRCIKNARNRIYRLVWEVFNGDVPKGYCVHHIDGNKLNDRLDNLMLITKQEHRSHHNSEYKGRHWYNNGFVEIFSSERPEGFDNGRLYSPSEEVKRTVSLKLQGIKRSDKTKLKISKSRRNVNK